MTEQTKNTNGLAKATVLNLRPGQRAIGKLMPISLHEEPAFESMGDLASDIFQVLYQPRPTFADSHKIGRTVNRRVLDWLTGQRVFEAASNKATANLPVAATMTADLYRSLIEDDLIAEALKRQEEAQEMSDEADALQDMIDELTEELDELTEDGDGEGSEGEDDFDFEFEEDADEDDGDTDGDESEDGDDFEEDDDGEGSEGEDADDAEGDEGSADGRDEDGDESEDGDDGQGSADAEGDEDGDEDGDDADGEGSEGDSDEDESEDGQNGENDDAEGDEDTDGEGSDDMSDDEAADRVDDIIAQLEELNAQRDELTAALDEFEAEIEAEFEEAEEDVVKNAQQANAINEARASADELIRDMEGFDVSASSPERRNPKAAVEFMNRFDERLRRIAEWIGRAREVALKAARNRVDEAVTVDEVGLTQEFDRLLASELAYLSSGAPRVIRAMKIAQFCDEGLPGYLPTNEGRKRGAMVVGVDDSGSMFGDRIIMAIGIALGLVQAAEAEVKDRPFCAFKFSATRSAIDAIDSNDDRSRVMEWASTQYGGGTNIGMALSYAVDRANELRDGGFRPDVVIPTDGHGRISDDDRAKWNAFAKDTGARLFYIPIGTSAQRDLLTLEGVITIKAEAFTADAFDEIAREVGQYL